MSGCRRCEFEIQHCHGTVVRHDDGARECTVEGCAGDPVGHDFVLVCADVWAGCCEDDSRSVGRLAGAA